MVAFFGGKKRTIKDQIVELIYTDRYRLKKKTFPRRYKHHLAYLILVMQKAQEQHAPEIKGYISILSSLGKHATKKGEVVSFTGATGLDVKINHKKSTKKIKVWGIGREITLATGEVVNDRSKNTRSVAPSFIHSLDAAHMTQVINRCKCAGVSIIGVHDCYVTHACDIDWLKICVKEEFVLLHSTPHVKDLFEKNKCSHLLHETGDWDIREVLFSENAFS